MLSTDAIKLALENNIDIVFLDNCGTPYGRIWHPKLGSTTLIRRRQIEIAETVDGLRLALQWVLLKVDGQTALLASLRKTRPQRSADITSSLEELRRTAEPLRTFHEGTLDERRGSIMGVEGAIGRKYFMTLAALLPERFRFKGRSRNPAEDEFNALLNYAYGILYAKVEKACIIAGLDPYAGFLHVDNYNKKSLVFDLIEQYRPWADEVIIKLFASRKVRPDMFEAVPGGMALGKEGKAVLIPSLNAFLDEPIRFRGRNIKRSNVIQFECHGLANVLIGDRDAR